MKRFSFCLALLVFCHPILAREARFYLGTYTDNPKSKGIYTGTLDPATGKLSPLQLASEASSPNFVTLSPGEKFLYAATRTAGGSLAAFRVETNGLLTRLNEVPAGGGTCHVSVDAAGKNVFAANYGAGSIASYSVNADGAVGALVSAVKFSGRGPDTNRQTQPHGHAIYVSPDSRFAYACDLGTDNVWIFHFDAATGKLVANEPASAKLSPGSGPRHLVFSPDGKTVFVASEMAHTVTVFARDAVNGGLTEVQSISTLPPGAETNGVTITTAEIALHPSGRWLYVSNRFYDSIAVFEVAAGKLKWIQDFPTPVKVPRGFAIDPTGNWLVVGGQASHKIAVLKIDATDGKLSATGEAAEVGAPVCVVFAARN